MWTADERAHRSPKSNKNTSEFTAWHARGPWGQLRGWSSPHKQGWGCWPWQPGVRTAPGVTPACPTAHSTLHSHHQWMVYEQIVFLYAQGNTNCHRFMETTELCSLLFSNHSVMLLSKLTDSSAQQSHRKYQGSRQCDRNKWCVSGCLSELERNSNKQKLFLLLPMNLSFLHASSCQALALIAICLPSVCQTNFTTTQTCL